MISVKYITKLVIISFLLHLVWENAQAPLFAGYQSFSQHFGICLIGVVGDVVITMLVLVFMLLLKRNVLEKSDFLGLAIIGFVIAVAMEQYALLVGRWGYAPAMPLIPALGVGLIPVLQMTLLLPLSFYLARSSKNL